MAHQGEYTLNSLKDSRIFYLRNPPKFNKYAAILIVVILLGVLLWQCTSVKAEQVKNSGIVVDSGVNTLTAEVNGKIISISVEEGEYIQEGTVLFTMDASEVEAQRAGYQENVDHYTKRLELIDQLTDAIENDIPNPFINSGDEQEFYQYKQACENKIAQIYSSGQVEQVSQKYINDLMSQKSKAESNVKSGKYYQDIIDESNKKLAYIQVMMDQIKIVADNPFSSYPEGDEYDYYLSYEVFRKAYKAYDDDKQYDYGRAQTLQSTLDKWYSTYNSTLKDINDAKPNVAQLPSHQARLDCIKTMISTLQANSMDNPFDSSSVSEEEVEFYNLFESYLAEIDKLTLDEKQEQTKIKYLSNMEKDSANSSDQLRTQKANVASCNANIAKYTVTAPSYGTVHYDDSFKLSVGAQVQNGQRLGSVNSGAGKQVELWVDGHNRAKLNVGEACKFTVDGLLQSEYGCVEAKILSISEDATESKEGAYFKVIVVFDNDILTSDKGKTVEIVNGMSVSMWVIYENATYIEYFLEKFGF